MEQETPSRRFALIAETAQSQIDKGRFSGIEWLVLRGGETWSRGRCGWSDAVNRVEMADRPLYRIFSMTKPIISTVALMLMERGLLRLFDPVAAYIPDFGEMEILSPEGKRVRAQYPIIIEHLLTHRAGLSYSFLPGCPIAKIYHDTEVDLASKTLAEFTRDVAALPLAFEPGTQWRYSVATDVLARVVEVVLDRDLPGILNELVFEPLGMADTFYMVPEPKRHRIMTMFGKSDFDEIFDFEPGPQKLVSSDIAHLAPADNPDFWRGGYGLFSTIDDYARFIPVLATGIAESGDRLLSRKTIELMYANRIPASQLPLSIGPIPLAGYGHGLAGRVMIDLGGSLGLTSLGECGWAGAASTYYWIDREEDLIGITMAQYLGSKIPLGDEIRRAVYQALDE